MIRENSLRVAEVEVLVDYLQLKEYMALLVADFHFDQAAGRSLSDHGHVAAAAGTEHVCFAAPAMQCGVMYFIKCHISCLKPKVWIFLGVTHLSQPKKNAETDASSFG